jgi:hypothetical protein
MTPRGDVPLSRNGIKRRVWKFIHRSNPQPVKWADWLFAALVAAGIFYLILA